MHAKGVVIDFEEDYILLDAERIQNDWKLPLKAKKKRLKKNVEEKHKEYLGKQVQSEIF